MCFFFRLMLRNVFFGNPHMHNQHLYIQHIPIDLLCIYLCIQVFNAHPSIYIMNNYRKKYRFFSNYGSPKLFPRNVHDRISTKSSRGEGEKR